MHLRMRVVALGLTSAALLAGSGVAATAAFAAHQPTHLPKNAVVFTSARVHGAKGLVLVEGKGLVVYTFTGDKRGHPGTCKGACAAIWPALRGVPFVAHGVKLPGKFGTSHGQITYNGWPLYLFTGEKPKQDHANAEFPAVSVLSPTPPPPPMPSPSPSGGGY
jgi:predicted lipoprotein with Yx(FWY)xxD motif